jgi:glycerol-3-phosphate dehydrogenase
MVPYRLRADAFRRFADTPFDLLVIGGGITGAGIALDAVTRGLKVLLIEAGDYAWGTSSRSTKLIHGGLRYLKQLELNLVREVGRERAIVHRNAPHLVHPEELLLPIVEDGSLGKYTTPVGLWLYEKLAGVDAAERFRTLDREATLRAEPLLNEAIVRAGAIYREYRTDDARLVATLLRTAAREGADAVNHCAATGLLKDADGQVNGVTAEDRLTGTTHTLHARCVVNAAGPWCDEVRAFDGPVQGKRLQRTKGVHLVFARERLPVNRAVYFDVPTDHRMVFAVPRGRTTYFGTTDTLHDGDIGHPRTHAADVAYLLAAARHMFPDLHLAEDDIESSWAGLRPLIHEPGKGPSELSRKDEIFTAPSGLLSIAGGKLTGYRKMAERITDMVMARLTGQTGLPYRDGHTESIPLCGGDFDGYEAVGAYVERLTGEGRQVDLGAERARYLVHTYGTEAGSILERAYGLHRAETDPQRRLLRAELEHAIDHEGVCTLSDFLIRRTGRLYFDRPALGGYVDTAAELLGDALGLTAEALAAQRSAFEAAYREAVDFPDES